MMPNEPDQLDLPEPLRQALQQLDRTPAWDGDRDQQLRQTIRSRFAGQRHLARLTRWTAGLAGAAAIVLLLTLRPIGMPQSTPARFVERATILDAFALARRLEAGQSVPEHYDRTGDGVIDTRDVQAWAQWAVRLEDEG